MASFRPGGALLEQVSRFGRIIRTFRFDWRSEAPLIASGAIAMVLGVAARLLEPWPLKYVFDYILDPAFQRNPILSRFANQQPQLFIAVAASAVIGAALLRAAAEYRSTMAFAIVGNRFLTGLRGRTFDHIQRLSLRFHDRVKTGDLVTRIVGDMGRLQEVGVTAFLPMVVNSATLLVMLVLMLLINIKLGLFVVLAFPLFLLFTLRSGDRIRSVARDQRKREGKLGAASAEAFTAIRTVQAMGLESVMAASFGSQNLKSAKQTVRGKRLAARLERGVDILIAVFSAVVLWSGARLVLERSITPGDLLVFLAYLKSAFKPMRDMAKYSGRLASSIASAERVAQLLDTRPELVDDQGLATLPASLERIAFEAVGFSYTPEAKALDQISFEARCGELVAVYGPSGSGKTTLINLLLRLYDPTEGRICIDGVDIRSFRLSSLRAGIAVVPQDSLLFNLSVYDNIVIGREDVGREAVEAACRLADAHDFITRLPSGYDTVISERGSSLSGGQQRRLAIARAAVRNTPILVLDEPLAGLDVSNRQIVLEAMGRLRQGRITFVILHDLNLAAMADQVLFIDNGRLVHAGDAAAFAGGTGALRSLYRSGQP
ncbi:MAG: ABC transporter ATP-binding protein [Synechococcaceae cyanobacterium]|nr:ABC transporter ATP-binding protein [Synechococcaceae cyanobacterium]